MKGSSASHVTRLSPPTRWWCVTPAQSRITSLQEISDIPLDHQHCNTTGRTPHSELCHIPAFPGSLLSSSENQEINNRMTAATITGSVSQGEPSQIELWLRNKRSGDWCVAPLTWRLYCVHPHTACAMPPYHTAHCSAAESTGTNYYNTILHYIMDDDILILIYYYIMPAA